MIPKSETIYERCNFPVDITWRLILVVGILSVLGATVYLASLRALVISVLERHDSSHGVFVPFITAYLLWLKMSDFKAAAFRPAIFSGLFLSGLGILIFFWDHGEDSFRLASLSFFLLSVGLVALILGREGFECAGFPILFLIAMIPLPNSVYVYLAEVMRTVATWGSVGLLKLAGVPHYLDEFNLYLNNNHLYVDYSCSGIRYLLSYLVFGTAYAFRFKDTGAGRLATVAVAIPLSIVGAILRLSGIFFTTHYIGPILAEGHPHILWSWTVFVVLLVGAIGVDQMVSRKKIKDQKKEIKDQKSKIKD
jgi:exosortase